LKKSWAQAPSIRECRRMSRGELVFDGKEALDAYKTLPIYQKNKIASAIRDVIASFPENHLGRRFLTRVLEQCDPDSVSLLFAASANARKHDLEVTNHTMRFLKDCEGFPVFYSICEEISKPPQLMAAAVDSGISADEFSRRSMVKKTLGVVAGLLAFSEALPASSGGFVEKNSQGGNHFNVPKIARTSAATGIAIAALIASANDLMKADMIEMVNKIDALVHAEIDKNNRRRAR